MAILAFTATMLALPAGLGVDVLQRLRPPGPQVSGFLVVIGLAFVGTLLGFWTLHRLRKAGRAKLRGLTVATLAAYGGACILLSGAVVVLHFTTR